MFVEEVTVAGDVGAEPVDGTSTDCDADDTIYAEERMDVNVLALTTDE